MTAKRHPQLSHKKDIQTYNASNRYLYNKVRKLTKYVLDNPNDQQAISALKIWEEGKYPKTKLRAAKKTYIAQALRGEP